MTAAAPLASPTCRDPGAPPWTWLPPHLRAAAGRWCFGLRPGATLRALSIGGAAWYSDGACLVNSGLAAERGPTPAEQLLEEYLTGRQRETVAVGQGDQVRVGDALIPAAHFGLVAELFPGALWSNPLWWDQCRGRALPAALARLDGEAVALVLPMTGTLRKV